MHTRWNGVLVIALGVGSQIAVGAEPDASAASVPVWIQSLQVARPGQAIELDDLLRGADGSRITTREQWDRRRQRIHEKWMRFLGQLPQPRCPLAPKVMDTHRLSDGVVRQKVRLQVEPGVWMECYLFVPPGPGRFPACICLHSTTDETIDQPAGLGKDPSKAFALDLARRGYVTLAPKNFLWNYRGQTEIRQATQVFLDRYSTVKGMAKMIHDASRCVDYLETLPMVRPKAIGAIGHSLGAKEVTFLQAFDPRVVCGVSSEGGVGLDFSNYHDPWYLGSTLRTTDAELSAHEVVALIAPRAYLLIGGNSADGDQSWPYVASVMGIYRLLGAPDAVGLFVHDAGHAVPASAKATAYRWLDYHLKPRKKIPGR